MEAEISSTSIGINVSEYMSYEELIRTTPNASFSHPLTYHFFFTREQWFLFSLPLFYVYVGNLIFNT